MEQKRKHLIQRFQRAMHRLVKIQRVTQEFEIDFSDFSFEFFQKIDDFIMELDEDANEKHMSTAMIENLCNYLNINAFVNPDQVKKVKDLTKELRWQIR